MQWHYFETCDSTNAAARRFFEAAHLQSTILKSNTISDGFIAETQTQGRGTQNRMWVSPPGTGLYMSLLWPQCLLPSEQLPFLPLVVGIAAIDTLFELLPALKGQVFLKAVNDLMTKNGEKLGGILIEAFSQQNSHTAVVIGLGLNLWKAPVLEPAYHDSHYQPMSLATLLPQWADSIQDKTLWRNHLARCISEKLLVSPFLEILLSPGGPEPYSQETLLQEWLLRALPGSQVSDLVARGLPKL
ncbi:MAG: biotin--[acetyl-CoA-carboxylase] ligase [Cyanobacteria bacterium]|nr:biotin--[acetyl-CoA-carboxylase] ligase [Cyanobacteriota bacterium]